MTVRRILRWPSLPESQLPKHPYRDAALLHGVLAGLIVLIAWATGGTVLKAVAAACVYFVLALAWTIWRLRQRIARDAAKRRGA